MPPLRPWIRKQKVKSFHRRFRQQIAHREQSVRAQHPHIFDLLRFAANFLYALGQRLNTEEICFRELLRHFAEKRTIAAPKIDMQRRAAPKKFRDIQTRHLHFRHQFDHIGKMSASDRWFNPRQDPRSEGKHLEQRRVQSDMKETI